MPKDDWTKAKRRDFGNAAAREGRAFYSGTKKKRRRRNEITVVARAESFVTFAEWIKKIEVATSHTQLDSIGRDLMASKQYIFSHNFNRIVAVGLARRRQLDGD